MRAQSTLTQMAAPRTRRIGLGFFVVLLASISVMNLVSQLQAEDPGDVTITYFSAIPMGGDDWFVDGAVQAFDLSSVTITMGGAAVSVGTITPDAYGYFSFELTANSGTTVTADATDGSDSSQADATLESPF